MWTGLWMTTLRPVEMVCQTACKPGSVRAVPVSPFGGRRGAGRPFLWDAPCGTPHATNPGDEAGTPLRPGGEAGLRPMPPAAPIRSCSRWGLPCRPCCQGRGALLPHHFTLARRPQGTNPGCAGGLFSVALSLGSPPPAVGRHRIPVEPGLSSVRRASPAGSGRPAVWRGGRCAQGWRASSAWYQASAFAIRGLLAIGAPPGFGRDGGRIAQLVEQLTLNQRAVGSSPTAPTN